MTHDEAIYTNPDDFNPDRYAKHPDAGILLSHSFLLSIRQSRIANRLL
jgi:cytochrome P450